MASVLHLAVVEVQNQHAWGHRGDHLIVRDEPRIRVRLVVGRRPGCRLAIRILSTAACKPSPARSAVTASKTRVQAADASATAQRPSRRAPLISGPPSRRRYRTAGDPRAAPPGRRCAPRWPWPTAERARPSRCVNREMRIAAPTPPPPTADQSRPPCPLSRDPAAGAPSIDSRASPRAQAGSGFEVAAERLTRGQLGEREPVSDARRPRRLRQLGRRPEPGRDEPRPDVPGEDRHRQERRPGADAAGANPARARRQIDAAAERCRRPLLRLGLEAPFDRRGSRRGRSFSITSTRGARWRRRRRFRRRAGRGAAAAGSGGGRAGRRGHELSRWAWVGAATHTSASVALRRSTALTASTVARRSGAAAPSGSVCTTERPEMASLTQNLGGAGG